MFSKSITVMCLLLCIILFGCGKKKGKDAAQSIDSLETASLSTESDDIFEEFYEEGEEKKEEKKKESPIDDFPTSSQPEFNPNGRYVVQVSCVLSKSLAQDVASRLENKGYPTYIAEVENPTPELMGLYYRIRIGGFTGVSKARDFGENYLTRDGYEFWVDNRSNDNVGMGGPGLGESSGGGYEQSYTPAPEPEPATTAPAEDWSAPEPTTPDESVVTQPSTPVPVTQPPAEEVPETTPATEAVQEPTPTPTPTPTPVETPPEPQEEWGGTEDEWGADTTGW